MTMIGYARVSTQDQDLSCHLRRLRVPGLRRSSRRRFPGEGRPPQLARLMKTLQPGDVVMWLSSTAWALDPRIARPPHQIDEACAAFKSFGNPLFDAATRRPPALHVLAAFASFERDLIRERTGEGASGRWLRVCISVQSSNSPAIAGRGAKRRAAGEESLAAIGQSFGVLRRRFRGLHYREDFYLPSWSLACWQCPR